MIHFLDILGSRFIFFVFKNIGLFSCFHKGAIKISSLKAPFLVGANGVRYGTPNDVAVDKIVKCTNTPRAIPKKPAIPPKKM